MEEETNTSISESLPGYTDKHSLHADDQGDRGEYSADFSEESNTTFVPAATSTASFAADTGHQEKNVRFDVEFVAPAPARIAVQLPGPERMEKQPLQPGKAPSTTYAAVPAPVPFAPSVYKPSSSMGPSHRMREKSKEQDVRVPASEVQSLEQYAVTTALGLHRPKMVANRAAQPTAKASRLPVSTLPQPAPTFATTQQPSLRANTLAGLGDAVSNDMLLDLLAGSVAIGRDGWAWKCFKSLHNTHSSTFFTFHPRSAPNCKSTCGYRPTCPCCPH
jgi:hypothetical protein